MAAATAPWPARILASESVISVGSSDVVPNLCMRRCDGGNRLRVGSSLNSTSPPPFTWVSMKPGASQAPSGRLWTGASPGTSSRGTRPR
jgi:hypothetical protein